MTLKVTRATGRDKKALLRLLTAQLDEHGIDISFQRLAAAVDGTFEDGGRGFFLIVRVGSTAVGAAYLSLQWSLEHGGRSGWLEEMYVVPSHRGHGIGTALLRAACDEARREGCSAIDLEVEASHARAEQLYEREGFGRHARARFVKRLE